MKIKATLYLSSIVLIASITCVPRAIAQVPCGPNTLLTASLFVNWPQLQYDSGHSGCNPYETILSTSTVGTLSLKWKHRDDTAFSAPVVADGLVYASSFSDPQHVGYVWAFNANTGQEPGWGYSNADDHQYTSPAVGNGVVYVGCDDSKLYALDAKTGKLLWTYTTGTPVSTPVVVDGVVYAGSGSTDRKVYALNAKTGQFLWMYATGGAVPTPAVKGSVVYVASDQIYALNASNGALLWKAPVSSLSSPAVVGNTVYVSSDQVYALNASTGALIWKYPVQSLNTPAIATGRLYVGARDKNIYALNASTGAFLWKYGPQDDRVASPVVANGVVYAVSYGTLNGTAHLSALDAKTGALLCLRTAESNEDSASSAVVANGIVYFSISWFGEGAQLYAYSITQGH